MCLLMCLVVVILRGEAKMGYLPRALKFMATAEDAAAKTDKTSDVEMANVDDIEVKQN